MHYPSCGPRNSTTQQIYSPRTAYYAYPVPINPSPRILSISSQFKNASATAIASARVARPRRLREQTSSGTLLPIHVHPLSILFTYSSTPSFQSLARLTSSPPFFPRSSACAHLPRSPARRHSHMASTASPSTTCTPCRPVWASAAPPCASSRHPTSASLPSSWRCTAARTAPPRPPPPSVAAT